VKIERCKLALPQSYDATSAVRRPRESGEEIQRLVKSPSDIILEELGGVEQVIHAACAVESAIRGQSVNPHDLSVQTRAAEIILTGVGAQLRSVVESADGEKEQECEDREA